MLSLTRFGHFLARRMAAGKSALPSGTLLLLQSKLCEKNPAAQTQNSAKHPLQNAGPKISGVTKATFFWRLC